MIEIGSRVGRPSGIALPDWYNFRYRSTLKPSRVASHAKKPTFCATVLCRPTIRWGRV